MKRILITVPENFPDESYNDICNGFIKRFGDDCEFIRKTDSSVIGGFVAEVNGEIFDLSIASQLKQLERHMLGDNV